MNFDASPDPGDAERDVIAHALEFVSGDLGAPGPYDSRWRLAGLRENAGHAADAADAPVQAGRRRRTPGATRA